jgi:hypothetical protein
LGRRRAERRKTFAHEDLDTWWTAVSEEPELAGLLTERRRRQPGLPGVSGLSGNNGLCVRHHLELLRQAGFAHAGPVCPATAESGRRPIDGPLHQRTLSQPVVVSGRSLYGSLGGGMRLTVAAADRRCWNTEWLAPLTTNAT